jgi:cell division protein FtsL
MSSADFEYAIKKDIRNNPIVREVDEARQRQLLRSLFIGGVLVAVVLFSAWQNFELAQHGTRLQQIQEQKAAELEINRRLRLDVETLRAPERIEKRARDLNLVWPSQAEAIVIERVTPAAPPDQSVVAAR